MLVASLATILPLIFAGVRWPSFLGEVSAAGNILTQFMIQMLHVVFLVLPLVTLFEFKFSPSVRMQRNAQQFSDVLLHGGAVRRLFQRLPAAGLRAQDAAGMGQSRDRRQRFLNTLRCGAGLGVGLGRAGRAGLAELPAPAGRQQPGC